MADTPAPTAAPSNPAYLTRPLADLAAWTRYFVNADIPVKAATAQALEELRAKEDDVDASMIADVVKTDPLMSLKLMAYSSSQRRPADASVPETVTGVLVMMGIAPFFRHFGSQPTLEDRLHDQPEALQGLRTLVLRAERARQFALGFAVHRADLDVDVILHAAFLHDFAEMLMWCHAPTLMLQIQEAQRADPTLRSAAVQPSVLHIELDDLAMALMQQWQLPPLLVRISDAKHAEQANVRNVVLATRLARHTMNGWDNAALPDDIQDIAELLNAAPRVALAYLHKIDRPADDAAG